MSKSSEERLVTARNTASLWMGTAAFFIGAFWATPAMVIRFGLGTSGNLVALVAGLGWISCLIVVAMLMHWLSRSKDGPRFVVYVGTCVYFILIGVIPESWGLAIAQLVGLI